MSDAENGNMNVPPQDRFYSTVEGVTAWRPVFDAIIVREARGGAKRVIVRRDDVVADFLLSGEQAAHLAALLSHSAPAHKDDAA
jgi:hypothetical protein